MTAKTRLAGVFAHPVHHSLSPAMHNAAFSALGLDWAYLPFDVHPDNLEDAVSGIRALGLAGVNVTIPHKERVIPFLDSISDEARAIGSVNTIVNEGGRLVGYSTDGEGFMRSLIAAGGTPGRTVILGAGGSARAIVYALGHAGASVSVANRTPERAVELCRTVNSALGSAVAEPARLSLDLVREAELIVNCTSVGMYPSVDEQPVPAEWLHPGLFVYDLIYNPAETALIRSAREAGARAVNGVGMLVAQGAVSFALWTGIEPPVDVMEQAVLAAL
ncbi:MAG: shikimate dehydrogenase [Armatimonadota bacterium]